MGHNLSVVRITNRTMEETFHKTFVPFYETVDQEWFDSDRHRGDSDFIFNNNFYFVDNDVQWDEKELQRPINFKEASAWVKLNIPTEIQTRLLYALEQLEKNETLAFVFS